MQGVKPIILIDEPHLLKGNKFTQVLELFTSLKIRFGATYPKDGPYRLQNVVYVLDSKQAFQNYLVKKITVHSLQQGSIHGFYIKHVDKKSIRIAYSYNNHYLETDIFINEDIGAKIGNSNYHGVRITKITKQRIFLSNQTTLDVNINNYNLYLDVKDLNNEVRLMVKHTIEQHFKQEENNFAYGIKTLSLFFIKNIDDYENNGPIAQIFEEEYTKQRDQVIFNLKTIIADNKLDENVLKIKKEYLNYLIRDFKNDKLDVHYGYFSRSNDDAYKVNLILKDKQKLLSLNTPLRFIFSVWALQEGWDNPNVFNICKISQTDKETSVRQQVGRGLRIAVNNNGVRLTNNQCVKKCLNFYDINNLNIIISSQENNFISRLQSEIEDVSYKVFDITGGIINDDTFIKNDISGNDLKIILNILKEHGVISDIEGSENYQIVRSITNLLEEEKEVFLVYDKMGCNFREKLQNMFATNSANVEKQVCNSINQKVKIRKENLDKFKILWEKINIKANLSYQHINENDLIENIVSEFSKLTIEQTSITVEVSTLDPQTNNIVCDEVTLLSKIHIVHTFLKDHIIDMYKNNYTKYNIPLSFYIKLFNKIDTDTYLKDPNKAKKELINIIKININKEISKNVIYKFSNNNYANTALHDNKGEYLKEISYTMLGREKSNEKLPCNYLYDEIVYDSDIEKQLSQRQLDNNVLVFAKLPKIYIKIPYGTYSPDFAYLMQKNDGTLIFLIIETKGYVNKSDIPDIERIKIDFAKIFFQELSNYYANQNIKIVYKDTNSVEDASNIIANLG